MADPGHIRGPVFINNCVAFRLIWKLSNGKLCHNIMHGTSSGNPNFTQAIVNNIWSDVLDAFTSSGLAGHITASTSLTQLGLRYMGSTGSPPVGFGEFVSSTPGLAGAATEPPGPLPPQIAFVVTLRTGGSGQANRGRVYLPGWNEVSNVAGGTCDPTHGQDAVDFISSIRDIMESAGFPMCIAHPARAAYTGKPGNDGVGTPHPARPAGTVPVTSIAKLNDTWDTVRLRAHL